MNFTADPRFDCARKQIDAINDENYTSVLDLFERACAEFADRVAIANWVTSNDGRLRAERRFQIIRISDKKTLLRARSDYICTNLTNGRPARMPDIFKVCFAVPPSLYSFLLQT